MLPPPPPPTPASQVPLPLVPTIKERDTTYGPIFSGNALTSGSERFTFFRDKLIIANEAYDPTPGLQELIWEKHPEEYTEADMKNYAQILRITNVYRNNFSPDLPP